MQEKIFKSQEMLNKLGARMGISITKEYLDLKVDELELCHEYQIKKQEEKEELRKERERLREEAKVAREIEERRQTLVKEEKHFRKAKSDLLDRLSTADSAMGKELSRRNSLLSRPIFLNFSPNKSRLTSERRMLELDTSTSFQTSAHSGKASSR